MGALDGKVVWVTGAGTGIGLAGARALAEGGASVVMSGRRADVLEREAALIKEQGGAAEALVLDVSNAGQVARVARDILGRYGKIDILVNSAGLNNPRRYWKDQTVEGWDQVIDINLNGTFYCVHAVLPSMRDRKDGLVINISSWSGRFNTALTGAAYNGSKHAVVALTETINIEECANGIRASVICPAEVSTPIMDRRPVPPAAQDRARMLQPEDLGRTIRFVAELPAHACVNEIVISPTWNRLYVGGIEANRR